jgi:predicted dehydrogenase
MGRRHLEAYLSNPEVKVEACSDVNPEALKFLKVRNVNCRQYTDWRKMLNAEAFDLLSVVTNGPTHAEITIEACKAKIPRVICEKPMATSIRDAKRMMEVAQANGATLVINYSRRWSNDYQRLKEKIKEGAIGELCEVYAVCGGGQLACNGSHFFDLMRFLSESEPTSVIGFVDKRGTPNPRGPQFTDPGAFGMVRFANGMRGFVDMYEDLGIPPRIEIVGSIGRVSIDETRNSWTIEAREGSHLFDPLAKYDLPLEPHRLPTEPLQLPELLKATISEILRGGQIACTGSDGLAALQMVMGFHASDREGNIPLPLPLSPKYHEMSINFT